LRTEFRKPLPPMFAVAGQEHQFRHDCVHSRQFPTTGWLSTTVPEAVLVCFHQRGVRGLST